MANSSSHRHARSLIASAALASLPPAAHALTLRSSQPFVGVTLHQYIQTKNDPDRPYIPREIVVNILEIDVTAPGVQFLMQPGNGPDPGEVSRTPTRTFVNSVGAQMGINVGFYDTAAPYPSPHTDLNHINVSNGSVYSTAAGGEPLFNISVTNVPSIRTAGPAGSATGSGNYPLYNAGGSNLRILTAGALVNTTGSYATTLNPHTAFGVSQDAKRVFLLTVDGRQNDYSEGMYTWEMAQLLKNYGAYNAVNLDGGGSTTMVLDDSDDGAPNARILNSPSDGASSTGPGPGRLVANSLAVFANHNPSYVPLPPVPYPGVSGVVPTVSQPLLLDRFESSTGHFAAGLTAGNNHNVDPAASSLSLDTTRAAEGSSSLRVDIASTNASPPAMQLRLLSGGAVPNNNLVDGRALAPTGYLGLWLLLPAGSADLYISLLVDDGTTTATGHERSTFQQVPADGRWHHFEWALHDPDLWSNFSGGNGAIDGPNAFLDSLYFSSAPATSGGPNWSGPVWVDAVTYNPFGTTLPLVPEPSTAALVALLPLLARRPRR
jgi:hypothetical protein